MNTFRRPMFRGGKVDSRGTGITSGLKMVVELVYKVEVCLQQVDKLWQAGL